MACGPYRVPAVGFRARSVRTDLAPARAPTAGRGARRRPRRSSARSTCSRASSSSTPPRCGAATSSPRPSCPRPPPRGAHYDDGDLPALLDAAPRPRRVSRAGGKSNARAVPPAPSACSASVSRRWSTPPRGSRGRRPRASRVLADGTCARARGHRVGRTAARPRLCAIVVADVLPVLVDEVEVVEGDTDIVEGSAGTSGSRSLQLAGSAVRGAAVDVLEQARQLAADLLEAAVDDIVVDGRAVRRARCPGTRHHPRRARRARERRRRRRRARRALRVRPGGRRRTRVRAPLGRRGRRRDRCGHACSATSRSPTAAGSSTRRRPRARSSARARRASRRPLLEEFAYDDRGNPLTQQPRRVPRARRTRPPADRRPLRDDRSDAATHSAHAASARSAWSPRRRPSTARCSTRSRTSASGTSTCPAHPNACGVPCVPRRSHRSPATT